MSEEDIRIATRRSIEDQIKRIKEDEERRVVAALLKENDPNYVERIKEKQRREFMATSTPIVPVTSTTCTTTTTRTASDVERRLALAEQEQRKAVEREKLLEYKMDRILQLLNQQTQSRDEYVNDTYNKVSSYMEKPVTNSTKLPSATVISVTPPITTTKSPSKVLVDQPKVTVTQQTPVKQTTVTQQKEVLSTVHLPCSVCKKPVYRTDENVYIFESNGKIPITCVDHRPKKEIVADPIGMSNQPNVNTVTIPDDPEELSEYLIMELLAKLGSVHPPESEKWKATKDYIKMTINDYI